MSLQSRQLAGLFQKLSAESQQSLLDFGEFLLQRESAVEVSDESAGNDEQKHQPLHHPRPDDENIINAIKRMRATYFMLNTDELLNETSSLMTQHIVHGREASAVIDELESLFESHYQKYLQS